jgi:hypothetical protein
MGTPTLCGRVRPRPNTLYELRFSFSLLIEVGARPREFNRLHRLQLLLLFRWKVSCEGTPADRRSACPCRHEASHGTRDRRDSRSAPSRDALRRLWRSGRSGRRNGRPGCASLGHSRKAGLKGESSCRVKGEVDSNLVGPGNLCRPLQQRCRRGGELPSMRMTPCSEMHAAHD